jgi:hypothetical protein
MPLPSGRQGTELPLSQEDVTAAQRTHAVITVATENDSSDVSWSEPVAGRDVAQVLGVIGGPMALLIGLLAKYTLVEIWACKSDAGPLVVHLVALATLLLALGSGLLALGQWRGAGREVPGDIGGTEGRTRMMATLGVASSAMSAVVIVAQWLPQLFVSPCQP